MSNFGSLNITDMAMLGSTLGMLSQTQSRMQEMMDSDLPNLRNNIQGSVNGTAIESHTTNMDAWNSQLAGMIEQMQELYNYLSPIYAAATSGASAPTIGTYGI